jgi:tetratricopeptide (TPR) repeat protein
MVRCMLSFLHAVEEKHGLGLQSNNGMVWLDKLPVGPLQSDERHPGLLRNLGPSGASTIFVERGRVSMRISARIPVAAALLLVLASTMGCKKLKERDQLVQGINAFKAGKYEVAIDFFQKAVAIDPSDSMAQLYLATAYSYQVIPNLDTPENLKMAQKALDGFNNVLAQDPNDLGALRQVASIHRNIKQYDVAIADEKKVIALDPKDSEAYYTIGNIEWNQSYKNATTILGAAGLTDDGNGNVKMSKDVCAKITAANGALVADTITNLQKAIDINPNYDNALDMMNLAYRRKADLDCGNDAQRKADLAKADGLVQQAIGARKANEAAKEKKLGGGISMQ